jgi:hypothetical protein
VPLLTFITSDKMPLHFDLAELLLVTTKTITPARRRSIGLVWKLELGKIDMM